MMQMREEMTRQQTPQADNIPVFNLFVRSPTGAGVWYPCGGFRGDEKSKALVESASGDGFASFLSSQAKSKIDETISYGVHESLRDLTESVVRNYPQLRKSRDKLEWGYKITSQNLPEELGKTTVVEPKKRPEGVQEQVKDAVGNVGENIVEKGKEQLDMVLERFGATKPKRG